MNTDSNIPQNPPQNVTSPSKNTTGLSLRTGRRTDAKPLRTSAERMWPYLI